MEYEFTSDWFSANIDAWKRILAGAKIVPEKILEIGSYERRSTVWIIENLISERVASLVAIDAWEDNDPEAFPIGCDRDEMKLVEARFDRNMAIAKHRRPNVCIEKFKGHSPALLGGLLARGNGSSFDLIYVDGDHRAPFVLTDLVLSFHLCRTGGLIFCDDYLWQQNRGLTETPKLAIDAFVTCFHDKVRIISERFYQLYLQKMAD